MRSLLDLIAQVHERRFKFEQLLVERTNQVSVDTSDIDRQLEQNDQLKRRFLAELEDANRADGQATPQNATIRAVL
jgi:hypothetical protein